MTRMIVHAGMHVKESIAATRVRRSAAALALLLGALVLIGWQSGNDRLTQVFPGLSAMNPMTAISLLLAGLALFVCPRTHRQVGAFSAAVLVAVGASKLAELFLGSPFAVDQLLFSGELGRAKDVPPNRMAPNTALALCL